MKTPFTFFSSRLRFLTALLLSVAAPLFFTQCEQLSSSNAYVGADAAPMSPASSESASGAKPRSAAVLRRPGLGTSAGDERYDTVKSTLFYRRSTATPDTTAMIHYNDEEGAKTMSESWGGSTWKHGGWFKIAGGKLKAKVVTGWDDTCSHFVAGDRTIVIGDPGKSWKLLLENETDHRVEVVVSVDGLDVMDGKTAKVSKHGYVIEKDSSVTISGWRLNNSTVKEFIFGSVAESKAAKAGKPRNVGVIGVAVYVEDEAAARRARLDEAGRRDQAQGFPGT